MTIFITGASSGFGRAVAAHLAKRGHTVYGTSRSPKSDITDGVQMLRMDVRSPESVDAAVDSVIRREGHIDVLINNAGMGIAGAAELASPDDIRLQMETNFIGCTNVCRAVLRYMRPRRKGLIINISSIAGIFSIPYQGLYSASKFAIEGYSQALAMETSRFGINVVIIAPGDFNTGFTSARRLCPETASSPDYSASFARVRANFERDELRGGSPDMLARRICRIIESRRPRRRYVVPTSAAQWLAVRLSGLLPRRTFGWILKTFYSM